jgi:4-amino-4-deoxy-L-arabinose transferase-like glycosyltransferase
VRWRFLTGWPAAVLLLILHWVLAVCSAADKSLTYDESMHLTGGHAAWTRGDYRLNPGSGLLPQLWVALPTAMTDAQFTPEADPASWNNAAQKFTVSEHFLYDSGNDARGMVRSGRAMIALLSVALGLCVFLRSRQVFGPWGGLLSLILYAVSPTMLAHARLMTADTAGALFLLLGAWGIWTVLQRITPMTLTLSSLAVAGMSIAKMSAPTLGFVGMVLLIVRLLVRRPLVVQFGHERQLTRRSHQLLAFAGVVLVHVAAAILLIWAAHGFKFSAFGVDAAPTAKLEYAWEEVTAGSTAGSVIEFARSHHLLPEAWLFGLADTIKHAGNRFAFLLGEHSHTGWWWFFPYTFLIKTPVGLLMLLGLGLATIRRDKLYPLTPLVVLFGVYWVTALATNLNIGHRHLLPVYPVVFVLAGAAAAFLLQPRQLLRVLVTIATLTVVLESAWVFPHYLSYFNWVVGGPRHGYKHVVDSSLDWGQDLPALRRWIAGRRDAGDNQPVFVCYFGVHTPTREGIASHQLMGGDGWREGLPPIWLAGGHYAISATHLQSVYGDLRGRWHPQHEGLWQQLHQAAPALRQSDPAPVWAAVEQRAGKVQKDNVLRGYRRLRLLRLCAYLRRWSRPPDAWAGYSILIYTLTDAEVKAALEGPMPFGS